MDNLYSYMAAAVELDKQLRNFITTMNDNIFNHNRNMCTLLATQSSFVIGESTMSKWIIFLPITLMTSNASSSVYMFSFSQSRPFSFRHQAN